MRPDRWLRLEELFNAAVELHVDQRGPLLDRECTGDPTLSRQVESLIISSTDGTVIRAAVGGAARLSYSESRLEEIGPYSVTRELGQGGMGTVYLAARADDEYQKQVAISSSDECDRHGIEFLSA